jgi:hypothetical protein
MSRAVYCREQARLCRELAFQLSNPRDTERLELMAQNYDAEAERVDAPQALTGDQAG